MTEPERRTTRQRRAVYDVLVENENFASAQELHQRLRAIGVKVGLATVYRTLGAMAHDGEIDVLRGEDGELRYRRCATEAHHHHLVCRDCGRVVEVVGHALESWVADAARQHGFDDVHHALEFIGTCRDCARGSGGGSAEANPGTD